MCERILTLSVELLFGMPAQAAQELDEDLRVETLRDQHEQQLPIVVVGEGRDRRAAKPLAGAAHHRPLAAPAVGEAGGIIGTDTHLVRPVNDGPFGFCLSLKLRVLFFYPYGAPRLVSVRRPPHGLLGGEAPLVQGSHPRCAAEGRLVHRFSINARTAWRLHRK